MSSTWWVGEDDLDEYQKSVISLPIDNSHFVIGPPGSGKTNLLLLRANWMYLSGYKNILIIVFTRTLQGFINSGGKQYYFPDSKVQTCRQWQWDLLKQYGVTIDMPQDDFIKQREYLLHEIKKLIEKHRLSKIYDAILLDEAQDYLPEEIEIFRDLAERLFAVADTRQKIYDGEDSFNTLRTILGTPTELRFHYRNGLKICKIADAIVKDRENACMADTSNYNEIANPSQVEYYRCQNIDDQAKRIIQKLDAQLKAYPNEMVGIICPQRAELMKLWNYISESAFGARAMLQLGTDREPFNDSKPIIVSTFHGIKGLEVRSLHMAGCNLLKDFKYNRNMAYTAITRVKTSLSLYYDDDIHGYLEAALSVIEPIPDLASIGDIFGGKK